MGLKSFKIGRREALELACDGVAHRGEPPRAWFDCGSDLSNLALATTAGWVERCNGKQAWLCPQCADKDTLKLGDLRKHVDPVSTGKDAA